MSRALGATLLGVDGFAVEVEVRLSSQLPRIDIVGLPEAAVRESAARVRAAIAATGHSFPDRRITVNLAPAGLRKAGAGLDLPIAVGVLAAASAIEPSALPCLLIASVAQIFKGSRVGRFRLLVWYVCTAATIWFALPTEGGPEVRPSSWSPPGICAPSPVRMPDVSQSAGSV